MKYILSLFIALWSIAAWGQEGGDGFNPSNPGEPGQRYNLTVNVTPDGAGSTSPSGKQQYALGESVYLSANANNYYQFVGWIQDGDTIVLAGSIPASLPSDIYERILEYLKNKKIRAIVDATGDLLMNVLKYKPFLIKPNNFELEEIFGVELKTAEDVSEYALKLKEMGAVNVLVSMAGDGAILADENGKIHACGVCSGTVKNSVGAGDSMVAGFIAGCEKKSYEYALKLGTAAGGATAFSDGLAKKDLIYSLLEQL